MNADYIEVLKRMGADPEGISEKYSISSKKFEYNSEGLLVISSKAIDRINFVGHPKLTFVEDGMVLKDTRCDCPSIYRMGKLCEHCVALLADLRNDYDDLSLGSIEPGSVEPEAPKAVPVSVKTVQPVRAVKAVKAVSVKPVEEADDSEPEPVRSAVESEDSENTYSLTDGEQPRVMKILLGNDFESDEPLYWTPNDSEQVFHLNTGIIGTMGTGKTQLTKSLIAQLYLEQNNNYDGTPLGIFIFDYKGDYNETKQDFTELTNAKVFKPYKLPYNPLALNTTKSFIPLLPIHTANRFKDTIAKVYNLGSVQQQILFDSILKAYKKQGIDPENPATWTRKAPTFEQVYRIYSEADEKKANDSLAAAMNKLHQFCIFESDPQKTCSLTKLLKGVVVMDLSGYDDDIQSFVAAITLDQFYTQMQLMGSSKTDGRIRQLRNIIFVDEADNFMSKGFPSLKKILKEGREFGVGVILSTQSFTHFKNVDDDYSRYILTWAVHNVSDASVKDFEYIMKFDNKSTQAAEVYNAVKKLEKHQSIIKISSSKPQKIKNRSFWKIYEEKTQSEE